MNLDNGKTGVQIDDKMGKMCSISTEKCDHKCGYIAHARIIRKNRCAACLGGMVPTLIDGIWDKISFNCEELTCNRFNVITKIHDPANIN